MPPYRYVLADVFTDRAYGGNQLAVLPDSAGLDEAQMHAIAREFNLSETTFVTPGSAPDHFRVRIFTPGGELPFAGHPIVGTAIALRHLGRVTEACIFDLKIGPVRVEVVSDRATFHRDGAPEIRAVQLPADQIAALVGAPALAGEAFEAGYGTAFLYIPLADRAAVAAARLRRDLWERAAPMLWGRGVYVHAVSAPRDGVTPVHARMFGTGLGVIEDPATGSAAAGLAGSLPGPEGLHRIAITQGVEMGRPSLIEATATRVDGQVHAITIGGGAVVVGEGRLIRVP
ncbi:MAG: PhzF family phenazine biosynthesis protein [Acetobacteraceae bacterium]|nr:PhzF family phenazine biosynthesis protein [Acetobacteraceae bacterium]